LFRAKENTDELLENFQKRVTLDAKNSSLKIQKDKFINLKQNLNVLPTDFKNLVFQQTFFSEIQKWNTVKTKLLTNLNVDLALLDNFEEIEGVKKIITKWNLAIEEPYTVFGFLPRLGYYKSKTKEALQQKKIPLETLIKWFKDNTPILEKLDDVIAEFKREGFNFQDQSFENISEIISNWQPDKATFTETHYFSVVDDFLPRNYYELFV
jgi:hypothetical protein